ncbi:hypothetical protein AAFN75_13365 [Algibacter sp. AS12]|uniref:hypothetical protein n=1 Tax=Algibacter sp. AS12 TaxID=3135773 RepID=UPI00398A7D3B
MRGILIILWIICPCFCNVNGQESDTIKEASFNISNEVNINNEVLPFATYFSEYNISKNWILRAENVQTNFGGFSINYMVKDFPLLAKYSISNKFHVLFGPTLNLLLVNGTLEEVSSSGTLGVQYEFNESFLMEARFNYNLESENSFKTSLPTTNSILKLGAKYKF